LLLSWFAACWLVFVFLFGLGCGGGGIGEMGLLGGLLRWDRGKRWDATGLQ